MTPRVLSVLCLLSFGAAATLQSRPAPDPQPLLRVWTGDPATWLQGLAEQPLTSVLREALEGGPQGTQLTAQLAEIEQTLGAEPAAVLADLADAGLELTVDLRRLRPQWSLRGEARDAEKARARLEVTLAALLRRYGSEARPADLHQVRDGVELWTLGEELALGLRAGHWATATDTEQVLATLAEPLHPIDTPPGELRAEFDLARLRELNRLAGDGGLQRWAEAAQDPRVRALLGEALASFGAADHVQFAARADGAGVGLSLVARGPALRPAEPLPPSPLPPSPRDLLRVSVQRALSVLADDSPALDAAARAELARQLGELELVFGGLDLRRDVLPALDGRWELVVRPLDFDGAPRPELPLPGLALITPLADGQRLRDPLVAAFQNLVALGNVDRAQKGEGRPYLLRLAEVRGDGALTAAHLVRPLPGEPVDLRYNLAPACAAVGPWFVLGSHEELVREVVLELDAALPSTELDSRAVAERLTVDGARLAALLAELRPALELWLALGSGADAARAGTWSTLLERALITQGHWSLELRAAEGGGLELGAALLRERP